MGKSGKVRKRLYLSEFEETFINLRSSDDSWYKINLLPGISVEL